ncbi:non-homologous end-joining DNA ligase [Paenibacillus sp. MSJ-34]|uniref:non-homologous end-joining DNA ligase n=1 Tax=Paenibacillus sp. MSJ-34 TaxID=2841529 RepID=UPI001C0FA811|nr:non-homologous end-joining DNA ligase [Paenibacillus sp. MSJ-34]MBU5443454.1 non-homologous end-joining DNA ligase [Paenibacillus sp. MSJ-34]
MSKSAKGTLAIDGEQLTVTNPDKMLWPEQGITKGIFLQKLAELAPFLLTYCRNRYLTTIRYPDGVDKPFFYQKNCPEPKPDFVKTAKHEQINYVHLDSLPTLLWLGNLACLEFHPSFHYIGDPLPAEWLIDLDPSREEEPRIMEAAALVGDVLHSLGIESVPKTSGATGVQIFVPIERGLTFDQLRKIGKFIGTYVVEKRPDLFTIERLKKDRGTKIYFDYLQHYAGKTLSAPYTPRARKIASVSTPLTWDEVRRDVHPTDFHLLNIGERLRRTGDLIAQTRPQRLSVILEHLK